MRLRSILYKTLLSCESLSAGNCVAFSYSFWNSSADDFKSTKALSKVLKLRNGTFSLVVGDLKTFFGSFAKSNKLSVIILFFNSVSAREFSKSVLTSVAYPSTVFEKVLKLIGNTSALARRIIKRPAVLESAMPY